MDLRNAIGLGVAGNFTGHLEQAGEASDFVAVEVKDETAPKGIFPFYIPGGGEHFLNCFPISHDTIEIPGDADNLQIEPEVSLLCEIEYVDGSVARLVPLRFGAHNDCSIRREGARKISEKKNWGPCSKGVAEQMIALDRFAPGGVLDHFRIASYLRRDGELNAYGSDSAATGYSYFHQKLLDWIVEKMNTQEEGGPLESIANWLEAANRPTTALISIGATRYTEYGESTYLQPGDDAIVVVYDARERDEAAVRSELEARTLSASPTVSILEQRIK
jgi:hypothetical protein